MDILGYNSYGYQDFGVATIYDFDIGDKISSYEYERIWDQGYLEWFYDKYSFEEVIAKEIFNNGDLITYTFDSCSNTNLISKHPIFFVSLQYGKTSYNTCKRRF